MDKHSLQGYPKVRTFFRTAGPLAAVVGLLLIIVAAVDFFRATGGFDSPDLFHLFFIGGPLMFVGIVMSLWGYMGDIARYGAAETVPVAKDVTNYMIDGTKVSVTGLVSGIAREIEGDGPGQGVRCTCGELNKPGAVYCDNCGKRLARTCPSCGETNDHDAKFCSACGQKIA
jgi:hypothetical protein